MSEAEEPVPISVIWKTLVHDELAYRGYTEEQIAEIDQGREHTGDCDLTDHGWLCEDAAGNQLHPEHDEADEIAGIIGRAFGWI